MEAVANGTARAQVIDNDPSAEIEASIPRADPRRTETQACAFPVDTGQILANLLRRYEEVGEPLDNPFVPALTSALALRSHARLQVAP